MDRQVPNPHVVRRWRRFGVDRLYVNTPDGTELGWIDLTTGRLTVADSATRDDVIMALWTNELAWPWLPALTTPRDDLNSIHAPSHNRASQSSNSDKRTKDSAPMSPSAAPSVPVDDLADNQPGAGVRARAKAEYEANCKRAPIAARFLRVINADTDERSWRVGATGEEAVGVRLERLHHHGWQVLHSIPVGEGDADIDHVLIGPGGVFTVNTKNHPGKRIWVAGNTIQINGHYHPYIRNARFEAQRASRMLSRSLNRPVGVRSVLVLLTGSSNSNVTIKERPADVLVFKCTDVPGKFRQMPRQLGEADVQAIYEVARRPETWR